MHGSPDAELAEHGVTAVDGIGEMAALIRRYPKPLDLEGRDDDGKIILREYQGGGDDDG